MYEFDKEKTCCYLGDAVDKQAKETDWNMWAAMARIHMTLMYKERGLRFFAACPNFLGSQMALHAATLMRRDNRPMMRAVAVQPRNLFLETDEYLRMLEEADVILRLPMNRGEIFRHLIANSRYVLHDGTLPLLAEQAERDGCIVIPIPRRSPLKE